MVSTANSSRIYATPGLEFPIVFIYDVGYMPNQYGHGTPEEEARLLYVVMTRAIEQLILTSERLRRIFNFSVPKKPSCLNLGWS